MPPAVVTSASEIPAATTANPPWPLSAICRNACMMPTTVPKRPTNGAVAPTVPRIHRFRRSLRLSCWRSRSTAAAIRSGSGRIAAAVERERQQLNLRLRRNLWILGTVGATAPFVGLFGTVVGIMHAFRQMALSGQGGFAVVAAGISEALVTTAGGIAVAIEAVVIYNFLNVHVGRLALELKLLVEEYLELVREAIPAHPGEPAQGGTGGAEAPRAGGER